MLIKLNPRIRDHNEIYYEIEENKITATIGDISETFDFTGIPDGELNLYDFDANPLIETNLHDLPILNAEKVDGVLTIEVLFIIDIDEDDERLLFPKPMTVDQFNELIDELGSRKSGEPDGEDG